MTTCLKILFYAYQIVVICSIPGGRWFCDIQSWSEIWHWLWSIETIAFRLQSYSYTTTLFFSKKKTV